MSMDLTGIETATSIIPITISPLCLKMGQVNV